MMMVAIRMVMVMFMMTVPLFMKMNYMAVVMGVRMAFVARTTEQSPDFVRREIRYDFHTLLKLVSYTLDVMGLHYRQHYFLVNRQGHIHFSTFDHSGPVLVADGVAEFNGHADN